MKFQTQIVAALCSELILQKSYLDIEQVETIYFGGGTPSLLANGEISNIIQTISEHFNIDSAAEITLEANPDDLTKEKLLALKTIGINRLSIGIQSFDDYILKFLNRAHDAGMAQNSVKYAREVGFENISVDLMYAIPGQDLTAWKKNVAKAIELQPEHISSYSLTIEERTAFGKWASQKRISVPDDDISATELIALIDALDTAGYQHYEISNFAKPSYISLHNSSYWNGKKYLGIGPSAHSYDGHRRQFNISNNHLYLQSIESGRVPATCETLSREDKINEWILTTLRTSWGTDLQKLRKEYQYDLLRVHRAYINRLIDNNLAVVNHDTLILTKPGRLLADKIASDLFAVVGLAG